MSFYIVEFPDGLHVIPFSWLGDNNKQAYWPPYKDTLRLCKAVINMESPVEDIWKLLDVSEILGSADNYPDATAKLKLMKDASDLENFANVETLKKSRARRHRILPVYPDSSDGDEQTIQPEPEDQATGGHNKERTGMPTKPANFVRVTKNATGTNIEPRVPQNLPHTNVKSRNTVEEKAPQKNCGSRRTSDKTVDGGKNPSVDSTQEFTFDKVALELSNQKETYRELLRIVNQILRTVDEINKRLISVEESINAKPPQTPAAGNEEAMQDALDASLPLGSVLEFNEFEKNLREKEFASRVVTVTHNDFLKENLSAVHFMRTIGGRTTHDFVFNVSKRCLNNSLAMQYSMDGKKKKLPLKSTAFLKTLIKAAKLHKPKSDEDEIKKSVSAWFAGAKLRFTRETAKMQRPADNAEDAAVDNGQEAAVENRQEAAVQNGQGAAVQNDEQNAVDG